MAFEKFKEMGSLMKQAKEMRSKMQDVQKELKRASYKSTEGFVTFNCNGEMDPQDCFIDEACGVDPKVLRELEKQILKATRSAIKTAKDDAASKLSAITGGMNVPGLT